MDTTEDRGGNGSGAPGAGLTGMGLEALVIPVSDVDQAKESGQIAFSSASDLASAMIRAATAHGEHEKRIGHADADWPGWYAKYMVAEQAGAELPV